MSERRTLSLKTKALDPTGESVTRRPKKRVVRRSDVEATTRLQNTKPPLPPKPKKKKAQKPVQPRKPAPKVERMKRLDDMLKVTCRVWRDYKPLHHKFANDIYARATERKVYFSKVVVTELMKKHCSDKRYLSNTMNGGMRYNIEGEEVCPIAQAERVNAKQKLEQKQRIPN